MTARLKNNNFTSYLEVYQSRIAPRLSEIDTFIKTAEWPVPAALAAEVLELSLSEIQQITGDLSIDKSAMLTTMERGSSNICRLYQREVACGSPLVYTREDIAYIYSLDIDTVNQVCDILHMRELTSFTLPTLFAHIPVAVA